MGQTVVAENKPGAGGIVGTDYVAHAAPDGYNIVLMDPGFVANPILQKTMPYDIFKDMVAVSIVSSSPEVLVVTPSLGLKTYADLVAYGKANPGKLNYGTAGVGTAPHLAAEHVEGAHRHRRHARPVQGHWAVLHRLDERQDPDGVFQHRRRPAVHLQRQRNSPGDHRRQASGRSIRMCRP